MRPVCPCKGCEDRTLTCHSVCAEYKAWKGQIQAESHALWLWKDSHTDKNKLRFWKDLDKSQRRKW